MSCACVCEFASAVPGRVGRSPEELALIYIWKKKTQNISFHWEVFFRISLVTYTLYERRVQPTTAPNVE